MSRPSRPARVLALLAVPALLFGCAPGGDAQPVDAVSPPAAAAPSTSAPGASAPGASAPGGGAARVPVEVDRDAPVAYAAGEVRTPCYRYRAPDPSWTLVPGSAGCSTGVAFGDDMLSVVQVHAVTAVGTLDELAARTVQGDPGATVEPVTVGGHDAVRAVSSTGAGAVPVASVVIAYPDPGLTGGGDPLTAIVVSAASGAAFDGFVERIVASLVRPDGSPI
ncbi:hypothetical protein [Microbacterium sp. GXF7504]